MPPRPLETALGEEGRTGEECSGIGGARGGHAAWRPPSGRGFALDAMGASDRLLTVGAAEGGGEAGDLGAVRWGGP